MKSLLLVLMAQLLYGCATPTHQTDGLVKNHEGLQEEVKLAHVPFVNQKENHCGPATMAMVMENSGKTINLKALTSQMYTEGMKGTFQSEMLSSARRNGMVAIPLDNLWSVLKEIEGGHPVIVFQNLGLSFLPQWHYAVALGYDLKGPDIILHTGPDQFEKGDMRLFERTWVLGGKWALLVLRPDELSLTASENTHTAAAAFLEQMGKLKESETAYKTILSRWPRSLGALIGLGNVNYTRKDFAASILHLKKATQIHPGSAIAWHNLAWAQGLSGRKVMARISALRAMELVDEHDRDKFRKSLVQWL